MEISFNTFNYNKKKDSILDLIWFKFNLLLKKNCKKNNEKMKKMQLVLIIFILILLINYIKFFIKKMLTVSYDLIIKYFI